MSDSVQLSAFSAAFERTRTTPVATPDTAWLSGIGRSSHGGAPVHGSVDTPAPVVPPTLATTPRALTAQAIDLLA